MITWGSWYWPTAIIACLAIVFGPELYALFTNHANLLSDWIWNVLHVPRRGQPIMHTVAWYLTLIAFWGTALELTLHFWFRENI